MPLPIGIDLGTTNSVISVYKRGRAVTLRVDGEDTVPSVVCFRDTRTTLVGKKALGMCMIRPESTVLSVKRKMGDRKYSFAAEGKTYSSVDIAALIIEKLIEGHQSDLGGAPRDAVITVPAYFTDEQRRDTKLAAEKIGLNVLRLLPEPTAAAIAIGLDKGRDQTILVYDLGGGTFDVSILKVENNDFRVQAVNGNHDLGGNDFDLALNDHALNLFNEKHGVDLRQKDQADPEVRKAMQMLTSACERVKMELSDAEEAFLDLPNFYQGAHLEAQIDRRTFESLIKSLVYETKDLVMKTLADAKLGVDDIDRLVLVGGSTKIPLVSRVLADTIKEPYIADNVDLAVSHGAAIMAANLYAIDESHPDYAPVELNVSDVVSHPISVSMMNEHDVAECLVVIAQNTPLPASGMALGMVLQGTLIASLPVYRGENKLMDKNDYVGVLTLTFEPSTMPTPIRFELYLDENGVLQVEGSIIDISSSDSIERLMYDPKSAKVKRKVRAEMKLPE